jgi:hypothetical protein
LIFFLSIGRTIILGIIPHRVYEVSVGHMSARFVEESDMLFKDLFINFGLHLSVISTAAGCNAHHNQEMHHIHPPGLSR